MSNKFVFMFQVSFRSLLRKQTGKRAMWEYPFAVSGVNITFMILQMLDLDASKSTFFFLTFEYEFSVG